jgi:hypothetical protein
MSKSSSSRRRPPASRPESVPAKPVRKKSARTKPAATPPAQALHRELITKRRGELAELAFALKAYHLGFGVSKPYGDSERYDVILDSRDLHEVRLGSPLWRVQVKCTTQLFEGLYRLNAQRRTQGRAVPYRLGEIDFLAGYVFPEDTWYIVPLTAFLGRTSLLFRPRNDCKPGLYDAYREAWPLLRKAPSQFGRLPHPSRAFCGRMGNSKA